MTGTLIPGKSYCCLNE